MVIRALSQKKGIDLMAAPHVTTKNGSKATIKIVDEFIYPSQYAPPQLPTSTVATNYTTGLRQIPPTITPAFPNSWTSKNLGVTLEAKPTITPDHKMISLELHPQITDFDGFINYGTPINTVGYNVTATNITVTPFSETLTTNTINQPVFTVREVNTSVMVKDGQTVIIGGLIREDIQHVEDKIPFLGDIPLAGRLFRSKSERKLKKNLIIFVTPKILNADGAPITTKTFPPSRKKNT
jgi:general secretion pathway protein D